MTKLLNSSVLQGDAHGDTCGEYGHGYHNECVLGRFADISAENVRKNDYICQILDVRWILLLTLRLLKVLPSTTFC